MDVQFNGVLFDLDGTLLDTANDLGAALNYVLKLNNIEQVPPERFRPIASDGAAGLLNLGFQERIKEYDMQELRELFLNYYENNIAEETCLYPGIKELLSLLDEKNIPWGIVTNKPEYLTLKLLPHYPEFKSCKIMVGGDSLPERKPHPLPILHALKYLNIEAKDCLYVGDAPRDIEAGKAANMPTAIAGWGYILDHNVCDQWQADIFALEVDNLTALFK